MMQRRPWVSEREGVIEIKTLKKWATLNRPKYFLFSIKNLIFSKRKCESRHQIYNKCGGDFFKSVKGKQTEQIYAHLSGIGTVMSAD